MSKDKEIHAKKRVEIPEGTNLNGDSRLLQLEAALKEIADYRFNTITRFPEIKYKDTKHWQRIDDYMLNSIVRHLKASGVSHAHKTKIGDLLESDFSEPVNPIEEYLNSLKGFKGDPIGELAGTVQLVCDPASTPHMEQMFRKFLEKWLVGAVANVLVKDRCANQLMPWYLQASKVYLNPPGLKTFARKL